MSTSIKKAESILKTSEVISKTPENYDTIKQKGDYENFYGILKASLITRLNEMNRTQNAVVESDTTDFFSIIRKSRNFLEKSGLFIEDKINLSVEKMKIFEVLLRISEDL